MNLSADLPAPRNDEPASLRQDILDELSDHLQCAIDRERQRAALEGEDVASLPESNLWQRAVARFGEPAKVVRQLWWDAMKEKIMSQRTQTASLVIMSLLCVGMFVLTWVSLANSSRQAQHNQQLQQELLAQMQLLADRPDPAPVVPPAVINSPAEWNELTFRCVWGSEGGEPAEGVRIYLESDSDNTSGIPPGEETSGSDGVVDFGKVLYGTYIATVHTPNHLMERISVSVRPGQDKSVTVVCPEGGGTESVTLVMPFDWSIFPESIRDRTWILCAINGDGIAGGQAYGNWDTDYGYAWDSVMADGTQAFGPMAAYGTGIGTFLINSSGGILPANSLQVEESQVDAEWTHESRLSRVASLMYELPEDPVFLDSIDIPVGGYHLNAFIAVVDPSDPTGRRLLAIQNMPMSGREGFGGASMYGGTSGGYGPMGSGGAGASEEMSWMFGGGGGRRGGGRSGSPEMRVPFGRLPLSYLTSSNTSSPYAEMNGPQAYGSMSGSGGPMGMAYGASAQYILNWNEPTTWDVIPAETGSIRLAELALRIPAGMEVSPIFAHMLVEEQAAISSDSVVDVYWKGLFVDAEGNVVPEEHVLISNVDVLTTGEQGDDDDVVIKQLFVSITPDESTSLSEEPILSSLWVRESHGPVRESAGVPIDAALLNRIKHEAVQVQGTRAELPTDLKQVWVDVMSPDTEGFQNGSICDVGYIPDSNDRGVPESWTRHQLLMDRIVHGALQPGEGPSQRQQVGLIVTADEAAVIERARGIGIVIAQPSVGPSEVRPLEQNPNLEEVLEVIEDFSRRTTLPPGMEVSRMAAHISSDSISAFVPGTTIDLVWSGLLMNAEGHVVSEEHVLITGLNLIEINDPIVRGELSFVRFNVPLTPDESAALNALRSHNLIARVSTFSERDLTDDSLDPALMERLQRDSAKYVSRSFIENDHQAPRLVAESKPVSVAAPDTAFDGSPVDDLRVGMLCDLYLQVSQNPESTDAPSDGHNRRLLSNRMVVENVVTDSDGSRESVVFINDDEVELFELAQQIGEVVAIPVYVASEIDPDEPNPGLQESIQTLKALLPEDTIDDMPVE